MTESELIEALTKLIRDYDPYWDDPKAIAREAINLVRDEIGFSEGYERGFRAGMVEAASLKQQIKSNAV